MSGIGIKRPNTYNDLVPPPNYVPGLGRGARGFVTQSDIGPANAVETAPGMMANLANQGEGNEYDTFTGPQESLFGNAPCEPDDLEAERIYQEIDDRMKERREDQREKREIDRINMLYDEHMDQQRQFEDLKRGLASVTMEEWNNLPEIGDKSLKRKREKEREIFTPVPDSVIVAKRMRDSTEIYLDPKQQLLEGFDTNSNFMGAAREKLLSVKLDRMSDSVSGQTVIDPRGYMTSLNSMKSVSDAEVGDIKKARLTFRSLINANPTNPQGWIAACRLEEQTGKLTAARKIIQEGCENCPQSELVWLEAVHLHDRENARIFLANAVQHLPRSVKIWQTAAELEEDVDKKRRVLLKALEMIPNSVVLWKEAISLEQEENAMLLLRRAVEQVPECVEFWLALAKLETYENARRTLNRARQAIPTEPLIWFTAAQLEEANGSVHHVEAIISKAIKSLRNNDVIIERENWFRHAYDMEKAGAIQTCGAITRQVLTIGVEAEDRRRTWLDDAEKALGEGAIETAKAIFAYMLTEYANREDLWIRAYELEDDFGTLESAEALLRQAVMACPASEALWLLLVQLKHKKQNDAEGARMVVDEAMKANVGNNAILSSERLWLTAFQIEWETKEYDRARAILERARMNCTSGRVWMKSALLEWEAGNEEAERSILIQGIEAYPEYDKLYMMLGQFHQKKADIEEARAVFRKGLLKCPFSVPLWILYVRLEWEHTSIMKARSLLEIARQKCPQSEDLWIESIRMERQAGNEALTKQLLAKARQTLPSSGRIWTETVPTIPKVQRRTYISNALKENEDDPFIIMTAAKYFWSIRKIDQTRIWMKRALDKKPDLGDFWALMYVFELQNGSVEQQNEVVHECVRANPRHGDVWTSVSKVKENRRKGTADILKHVAEKMKNVIVEFNS